MKKIFFKILLFTCAVLMPVSATAGVSVHVDIPFPPPIIFPVPPLPVVIPETNVYVVPDIQEDIFFYGGWWWRPWEGRWYRSRHYDKGWIYYRGVPSFHRHVPPGWRESYRERQWKGHPWEQYRVHHKDLQRNWRGWEKNKHWEKKNYWGVKELYKEKYRVRPVKKPLPRDHYHEHGPGPYHPR